MMFFFPLLYVINVFTYSISASGGFYLGAGRKGQKGKRMRSEGERGKGSEGERRGENQSSEEQYYRKLEHACNALHSQFIALKCVGVSEFYFTGLNFIFFCIIFNSLTLLLIL